VGSRAADLVLGLKATLLASTPTVDDGDGASFGWSYDLSLPGAVAFGVRTSPDGIRPAEGADAACPVQVRIGRVREPDDLPLQLGSQEYRLVVSLQGWAAADEDTDEARLLAALALYAQVQQTIEAKGTALASVGPKGESTAKQPIVRLLDTLYERGQGFTFGYFEAEVEVSYRARIRRLAA